VALSGEMEQSARPGEKNADQQFVGDASLYECDSPGVHCGFEPAHVTGIGEGVDDPDLCIRILRHEMVYQMSADKACATGYDKCCRDKARVNRDGMYQIGTPSGIQLTE
jgi:hypothetical protein